MKVLIEILKNGLEIYFEALPEYIPLSEILPEETPEEIEKLYLSKAIFCAKVSAEVSGVELAVDYLGGCIYESEEDFYTKYKDDYFSDMVETVKEGATKEAQKKIKELNKILTKP